MKCPIELKNNSIVSFQSQWLEHKLQEMGHKVPPVTTPQPSYNSIHPSRIQVINLTPLVSCVLCVL